MVEGEPARGFEPEIAQLEAVINSMNVEVQKFGETVNSGSGRSGSNPRRRTIGATPLTTIPPPRSKMGMRLQAITPFLLAKKALYSNYFHL